MENNEPRKELERQLNDFDFSCGESRSDLDKMYIVGHMLAVTMTQWGNTLPGSRAPSSDQRTRALYLDSHGVCT